MLYIGMSKNLKKKKKNNVHYLFMPENKTCMNWLADRKKKKKETD